jgi:uncharacterized protein
MNTGIKKFIKIGDEKIHRGERKKVFLEVAALYDFTKINIPLEIIRGVEDGPVLFISAAIHGDEINGIEIVKSLLANPILKKIKGTLIAAPVVNVFGFNNKSRYLPDRRDLNRSFPGNAKGSLASRMAHVFLKEVVSKCTHGIDLHTGAIHRSNFPQIRANLEDKETRELAEVFSAPLLIHSELRDGSLREAARKRKVKTLLYEAGEALRYDDEAIKVGRRGCLSVMRKINMLPPLEKVKNLQKKKTLQTKYSYWARAPHSGSFRSIKKLGDMVKKGERLAVISDVFGSEFHDLLADEDGVIIGMSTLPLVNRGDAMFHLGIFKSNPSLSENFPLLDDSLL